MTQFEKTFNLMKKPWAIVVYSMLVILAYAFLDKPLATYFHQLDLRTNLHILNILTTLGKLVIYLVLLPLAGLYFRFLKVNPVYEARSWYLFACLVLSSLVCFVLKIAISRARPELLFSINAYGFYGFKMSSMYWSLPSGHSTTVVSLAAGLGVIFPRYFYTFLGLAFMVILTRVSLYYHYLSDVMSAFYLTLLVVGYATRYIKENHYLNSAWEK